MRNTIAHPPSQDKYCKDNDIAGSFVNHILYRMCWEFPDHDDARVTADKMIAIGRIYAASPERGAAKNQKATVNVVRAIAESLVNSGLDGKIREIGFLERISPELFEKVTSVHELLEKEIYTATDEWAKIGQGGAPKIRHLESFVSKYLHFHRPNAFPIMDRFAKHGLRSAGEKGAFGGYKSFCSAFLRYAEKQSSDWTPRSLDSRLLEMGRNYLDRKAEEKDQNG